MLRILAAALLLAATVPATTFERVSIAELTRRARRVCAVECDSCRAERDPDSGVVFTHVRLRLLEDLKGRSARSVIELRIAGGEADGVKFVVPGMPRFRPGEESVLLLGDANRAGYPTILAARRGMLRLVHDRQGRRFLRDPVDGFDSLKGKRRVQLAEFRAAVRAQKPRKDEAK